ncbi:hypothetical protein CEXT_683551 [Caerostris extrusa]|uniref:Uncharacterized protein n=1 Tax=Caerostris extrusa TaxID=172846 RepID=A0AAV4NG64_CAEEX|nr:hypothetical protein CEXT_683551 [Caerostris extrusa]
MMGRFRLIGFFEGLIGSLELKAANVRFTFCVFADSCSSAVFIFSVFTDLCSPACSLSLVRQFVFIDCIQHHLSVFTDSCFSVGSSSPFSPVHIHHRLCSPIHVNLCSLIHADSCSMSSSSLCSPIHASRWIHQLIFIDFIHRFMSTSSILLHVH